LRSAAKLCDAHGGCESTAQGAFILTSLQYADAQPLLIATDAGHGILFRNDVFMMPAFCQGFRTRANRVGSFLYLHAVAWNEGRVFDENNWHCEGSADTGAFDLIYDLTQNRRVLKIVSPSGSRYGKSCKGPLDTSIQIASDAIRYRVSSIGSPRVCEGSVVMSKKQ
jgi:hypothetical protein